MSSAESLTALLRERLEEDNIAALLAELKDQMRDKQANVTASGDEGAADGRRWFGAQYPASRGCASTSLLVANSSSCMPMPLTRALAGAEAVKPVSRCGCSGSSTPGFPCFDQQWRPYGGAAAYGRGVEDLSALGTVVTVGLLAWMNERGQRQESTQATAVFAPGWVFVKSYRDERHVIDAVPSASVLEAKDINAV